jgi:hypothetical protein
MTQLKNVFQYVLVIHMLMIYLKPVYHYVQLGLLNKLLLIEFVLQVAHRGNLVIILLTLVKRYVQMDIGVI